MDWEQKARAIDALSDIEIGFNYAGDWMCNADLHIKDGHCLKGGAGHGKTIQAAVEQYWDYLTQLGNDECLVVNERSPCRRHVRWNGFMWADVPMFLEALDAARKQADAA